MKAGHRALVWIGALTAATGSLTAVSAQSAREVTSIAADRLAATVRVVTRLEGTVSIVRTTGSRDVTFRFRGDGKTIQQTQPALTKVDSIHVVNGDRFQLDEGGRMELLVVSDDGRSTVAATERDLTRPHIRKRVGRTTSTASPEVTKRLQRILGVKGIKTGASADEALLLPLSSTTVRAGLIPVLIGNAKDKTCRVTLSVIAGRSYPLAQWNSSAGPGFYLAISPADVRRRYELATSVRLPSDRRSLEVEVVVETASSKFVRPLTLLLTDEALAPANDSFPRSGSETERVLRCLDLHERLEASRLISESLMIWAHRIPPADWAYAEDPSKPLTLATFERVAGEHGVPLAGFRNVRFIKAPLRESIGEGSK